MKYLMTVFIGLLLVTGCVTENKEESTASVKTTEEAAIEPELSPKELADKSKILMAKVIDPNTLELKLNGEEKWVINDGEFTQLMKIKQQIYVISGNMENYTVESYNDMGNEFLSFVKSIPAAEDENANVEFQKIITATQNQCLFLVGSDLQQAQIAVINLSTIYDEVPKYFIGLKK